MPRRTTRRPPPSASGSRLALWLLLGIVIVGFAVVRLSPRRPPRPRASLPLAHPQPPPQPSPPAQAPHPVPSPSQPTQPAPEARARCAIIIDDVGYNAAIFEKFLALDLPLNFAVLPRLSLSRRLARAAEQAGHTVLLHLPMEPVDPAQVRYMGPGAVTTAMSDEEIAAQVAGDLESVGAASGINNHMGSKACADPRVMRAVMGVAKERGLFFVDSGTTPHSAARDAARRFGVDMAERDVFLDTDVADDAQIEERIRTLIARARERGSALGIGHAREPTARVLGAMRAEFARQGVRLVPAGDLVRPPE